MMATANGKAAINPAWVGIIALLVVIGGILITTGTYVGRLQDVEKKISEHGNLPGHQGVTDAMLRIVRIEAKLEQLADSIMVINGQQLKNAQHIQSNAEAIRNLLVDLRRSMPRRYDNGPR